MTPKSSHKKTAPQLHDYGAERKRRNLIFIVGGGLLAIYLITLGSAWLILKSGIFYARSVHIEGMKTVSREEVEAIIRMNLLGQSLMKHMLGFKHLGLWPHELDGSALKSNPSIKHIDIEKSYTKRSITVTVTERLPYGIWCVEMHTVTRCMWLDDEGIVFRRGFLTEGNLIRIVHDSSRETLALGERALPESMMPALRGIFDVLDASSVSVKKILIRDMSLEEVEVLTYAMPGGTKEGPHLYFSLRFLPSQALTVLQPLLDDQKAFAKLQYIDFRVEHRAYSK